MASVTLMVHSYPVVFDPHDPSSLNPERKHSPTGIGPDFGSFGTPLLYGDHIKPSEGNREWRGRSFHTPHSRALHWKRNHSVTKLPEHQWEDGIAKNISGSHKSGPEHDSYEQRHRFRIQPLGQKL
jgi:hypothetical protein